MSSMFMWRHIYKHQGGRGLIKYIFLSPLLKEKEKGEGADLGRWDCSGEGHFQISLIKWSSGAIGVNSIVLASPRQHVAFNSSLKERMSGGVSRNKGFRFDWYSPEIPVAFWSGSHKYRLVSSILHACVICHHVCSWGKEYMIPRPPEQCHKLKLI